MKTKKQSLIYLFDPICGWCYGSLPSIKQIAKDSNLELEILASGIFIAEQAVRLTPELAEQLWRTCKRIQSITGQVFGESFKENILFKLNVLDSDLPSRATVAAKYLNYNAYDQINLLETLERNLSQKGVDITNYSRIIKLLKEEDFSDIATVMEENNPAFLSLHKELLNKANELMNINKINGVPALLRNGKLIDNSVLYLRAEETIRSLKEM